MSEQNIKLFCIPGGGASAFVYWKYTKYLNKNIKLCLLELPGRGCASGRNRSTSCTL